MQLAIAGQTTINNFDRCKSATAGNTFELRGTPKAYSTKPAWETSWRLVINSRGKVTVNRMSVAHVKWTIRSGAPAWRKPNLGNVHRLSGSGWSVNALCLRYSRAYLETNRSSTVP